ncbi:MAG: ABC transporter permease, partial [Burkholderiaceae bacterium]|nr:ABC transporter permease [Burkholderiaceae bacterium]
MSFAPLPDNSTTQIDAAPWRQFTRDFFVSRLATVGFSVLLLLLLIALFAPLISPQNPYDLATLDVLDSRLAPNALSSDGAHRFLLGSDEQGRDMLSAIFYGLRISLLVGISSTVIALLFGLLLGLVAGYVGGRVEALIMRIADIQLSFPAILIALILLALTGQGVSKIIFALVAVQWAYYARTARSAALVERNKEYIEAAIGLGLSPWRIVFRHLLPNCLPPLIVIAALQIASA